MKQQIDNEVFHEWFNSLMNIAIGQVVLAISAVATFISTAIVIKLSKSIEYKR